jgi:hypothetical protein
MAAAAAVILVCCHLFACLAPCRGWRVVPIRQCTACSHDAWTFLTLLS